jgi:hypothetical protein
MSEALENEFDAVPPGTFNKRCDAVAQRAKVVIEEAQATP